MSQLIEEINKRKTFAIISHPDAGKTTLTEKLLLFGGAIQTAGAVKSNKIKKSATSDFMEIERQRGISVATSVMGFKYGGHKIIILDTPGHQDFQEDTYRTLSAADSVIVVIDVAKGVETQTEKLVSVCRMRNIPIIVFINKLDRDGLDGFDLIDELEQKLGLTCSPQSWPVGMGPDFKGIWSIYHQKLVLFSAHGKQDETDSIVVTDPTDPILRKECGDRLTDSFLEDLEMVETVFPKFDMNAYLKGELSPVFFGSAINNFGVKELLECFNDIAPNPSGGITDEREIKATEPIFTGFVFKIHANMDPKHRDRIAFVRVVSGQFERNTNYYHTRIDKKLKFSNPTAFMASKKSVIDSAWPGDIIGLYDSGNFKIGDTLTEGEKLNFKGIPSFSPEMFRYVVNKDPMKTKQLNKGIEQLMDEGVAQMFVRKNNNRTIIGTVGALQYEVIKYRLEHEYGAKCDYEPLSMHKACWITSDDSSELANFKQRQSRLMATDKYGRDVFLAESSFTLQMIQDQNPKINFHFKSEF